MNSKFDVWSDRDIRDIVDAYPMASIVPDAEPFAAIEMPVLLDCTDDGKPIRLIGHLPRRAPAAALFASVPQATFIFRGPDSYISPAMAGKSDWAPTWNFVVVRIAADVVMDDTLTDPALDRTVAHMERNDPAPWNSAGLGDRYQTLRNSVVGFAAPIRAIRAKFKLGQDEQRETFAHILACLGNGPLSDWMERMNLDRD